MRNGSRCFCLFLILVLTFIVGMTIFIFRTARNSNRIVATSAGSPADSAALADASIVSARDSAKPPGAAARSLAESLAGLIRIDEQPVTNASRWSPPSPSPPPTSSPLTPTSSLLLSNSSSSRLPPSPVVQAKKCSRPAGGSPTRLCVPRLLSDLNSTCPRPLDHLDRPRSCGAWRPMDCSPPLACVAVIVPYRNRLDNLLLLAHQLHSLLRLQQAKYGLYVVEQDDARPFNRAKLLNIGYSLSRLYHKCDCFVFHDADKLPQDARHVYECDPDRPRHMVGRLYSQDGKKYTKGKLYFNFFGGVTALTGRQFESVNGNSNLYYGWGREDDELSARLRLKRWRLRYSEAGDSAGYVNLGHASDITVNSMPWPSVEAVRRRMAADGLSSLRYNLTGVYCHPLFTVFRVSL